MRAGLTPSLGPAVPARSRTRPDTLLPASGWALLATFSVGAAVLGGILEHPRRFEVLYAVGFIGYVIRLRATRSGPFATSGCRGLLIGATALRLPLLLLPCSDDVNRYLWEGRIQWVGHNPYAIPPDSPRLAHLRDDAWPQINHPAHTAVYPPLTMIVCAVLAGVWPSALAFKLLHTAADLVAVALLAGWLRRIGRPPTFAAAYALCPLTLTAFAAEGHNDSLMIAALVTAGYAFACARPRMGALFLGAAIGFKLIAVLLLPWLIRRHARHAWPVVLAPVLSCMPYLGAGWHLFEGVARFATEGTLLSLFHDTLANWLAPWLDHPRRAVFLLLLVLVLACMWWTAFRDDLSGAAVLVFSALLIASPIVHYWYLTWVLAFLPLRFGWTWIAAAAAMGLYFEVGVSLARAGQWLMPPWVGWILWTTFGAAFLTELRGFVTPAAGQARPSA